MPALPYALARPLLFGLDAERSHELTLAALAAAQRTPLDAAFAQRRIDAPLLLAGLRFPNRVGLAAGFDKNGRCIDAFGAMGFGHIEVGTVTPLAQAGNPRPRMFRLAAAGALINRLGFNNDGVAALVAQVKRSRYRAGGGILGINIGKNALTPIASAADDYLACLDAVHACADYITINLSSPNTAQLRELQADAALERLLEAMQKRRTQLAAADGRQVPILVKIAPDLEPEQIDAIAAILPRHGIDGVVATNTTLARSAVAGLRHGGESGGLSGKPLRAAADAVVRRLRAALGPNFPIIGVGGVMDAADAMAKRAAGADLVQLYSGLVYAGPLLVTQVAQALAAKAEATA
ncbi:MAG: quinone-dependent dihydroorotate dehydrogenase [Pseudomonadota bacterium]|nr:quinone-dependent dihydroorotate dehydrogenase [Pseudomonadota bacterium]